MLRSLVNRWLLGALLSLPLGALAGCGGGGGHSGTGSLAGYVYTQTGDLTGYVAQSTGRATTADGSGVVLLSEPPNSASHTALAGTRLLLKDAAWVRLVADLQAKQLNPPPVVPVAEKISAAEGAYAFQSVPAGKYVLEIEFPGAAQPVQREVSVYPGLTARGTEVPQAVNPAALVPGFSLLVQVPQATSFAPVVAATVALSGTPWSVSTGADGRYVMGGIPEGYYFLQIAKEGFAPRDYYVEVVSGKVTYGPYSPAPNTNETVWYDTNGSSSGGGTATTVPTSSPPPTTGTPTTTTSGSYDPADEGDTTGDTDDVGDTLGQTVRPPTTTHKGR
ncbi:carboxypeptidase regulatory-like domain-containing protein [bacterium]|nr:carboxypeptidase regulatory-like domain-containing protein [bacterium]NDK13884.1 carboxypeptidase regulatory-like domain-containing protein [Armatimonadota bacterium]PIU92613.1 MAG: hypothetical protein COS65_17000 [Armatimonadetes bacterium CG06_land_8_20_14_3_00_66_21]PIX46397.1 MAG: hypothetical protein COZ57_12265 [Armatimonadetes bacterium CG_4_8_14_3_um_filter_66_20]PIY39413.1 MAG: hypothetical protein COZ06_29655 [Armatimonadetes bacterium CG_4_10_14_3_um_filter_66_18]PIZ49181.1 MAG: